MRSLREVLLAGDGEVRRQPDEPRGGGGREQTVEERETLIYPLPPHGKRGDESGLRDSNPVFGTHLSAQDLSRWEGAGGCWLVPH